VTNASGRAPRTGRRQKRPRSSPSASSTLTRTGRRRRSPWVSTCARGIARTASRSSRPGHRPRRAARGFRGRGRRGLDAGRGRHAHALPTELFPRVFEIGTQRGRRPDARLVGGLGAAALAGSLRATALRLLAAQNPVGHTDRSPLGCAELDDLTTGAPRMLGRRRRRSLLGSSVYPGVSRIIQLTQPSLPYQDAAIHPRWCGPLGRGSCDLPFT
jgi:hypothetical protein